MIAAIIVGFVISLAHGRNGEPYDWLAAIGGRTYIAAIVRFRIRG